MKYLARYVSSHYNGFNWDSGNYTLCPADTSDEQIQCNHYEHFDAETYMCRFCNGDHCMFGGEG